jgi:hypothetical protein
MLSAHALGEFILKRGVFRPKYAYRRPIEIKESYLSADGG